MAWQSALRSKDLDDILAAAETGGLQRHLSAFHVTLLGIGAIIGAGIFATIGTAAAGDAMRPGAGPSLMLSFVITAGVCGLTALCYAELASMVPLSGSAYTYSYATLGELVAWIIGWDLIIEYAVGNVAVAIGWAGYFKSFLDHIGVHWPFWLSIDYRSAAEQGLLHQAPHIFGIPIVFNLLAALIVFAITWLLIRGIRESAWANAAMVIIKVLVLILFIAVAVSYVSPSEMVDNWTPFQPNGWEGTLTAAAVVFFSYIGFDAVSTVAEETRNPGRDIPIGIIASLIICTLIYVVVSAVFTGILPFDILSTKSSSDLAESLTMALEHVAPDANVTLAILAFGAVVAHTAVLLVFQLGQPRIFFAMARDGLLPKTFAKVHPKHGTPHVTTILTGVVVGLFAGVTNISEMVDLTSIGTLFAFVLVCIGVPILRARHPHRPRAFKVPFGPYIVPVLGAASCVGLMYWLPGTAWWRFVGWLLLGLGIYCGFGFHRSVLGQKLGRRSVATPLARILAVVFITSAVILFVFPYV
ncbi:MAG TPA: amino acid permease [Kofleriaceae bacterium]|nr:amino acid permease [Kofleriaceae bacterium]